MVKAYGQRGGKRLAFLQYLDAIGLALFTTILGLAIAIPTLIGHSYLSRLIDKRTVSLNWVTARINDAIHPKQDDVIH